jgi:hypothetical protein
MVIFIDRCYKHGMLGFSKPKLPVSVEEKEWVDRGFIRLGGLLGWAELLHCPVVLPTPEHFPDPYDGTETGAFRMFRRVATAMKLSYEDIEVTVFADDHDSIRKLVPFYSERSSGAAGLYHHDPSKVAHISINETKLKDPVALVATLAHELGHVILLRPGLLDRNEPDMEPLTDLLTVFMGLGVLTSTAAMQFKQFTELHSQGWSAEQQGYLSEQQYGYALARFTWERGETKPAWTRFLTTNVGDYFKRSAAWLAANKAPKLRS